jgi:hypothetical protein
VRPLFFEKFLQGKFIKFQSNAWSSLSLYVFLCWVGNFQIKIFWIKTYLIYDLSQKNRLVRKVPLSKINSLTQKFASGI